MNEITRLRNILDWLTDNNATLHFRRWGKFTTVALTTSRHKVIMDMSETERKYFRDHMPTFVIEELIKDIVSQGGYTEMYELFRGADVPLFEE